MTPEERALLERLKPKVEPTSALIGPLYDAVEEAIELIDCAFFATRDPNIFKIEDAGDAIRGTLNQSLHKLRETKNSLHDMVAWAS